MSNTTICDVDNPDPWMITHDGKFYLTFTLGNRIEIWCSRNIEDFRNCEKVTVHQPPPGSDWSADVWAPELHRIQDQWYIYFCAAHPGKDVQSRNASHRTLILRSSHPDPMQPGSWFFVGPLKGLPDHWNIDATVFSPPSRPDTLYCCYSGWPLGDHSDTQQDLFVIKLASPDQAVRETLTCISKAELPWERPEHGRRGVNEGATFVSLPGFEGIVYSANGSWTCDYQLGIIALTDTSDVCNPASWQKRQHPLLVSDKTKGPPFGPGHASFVVNPYGLGTVYCVYHGTERPDEGWRNRKARVLMLGPECFQPGARTVCCADFHDRTSISSGSEKQQISQSQYPGGGQSAARPQDESHSNKSKNLLDKMRNNVKKAMEGH